jgi:hypothetical protein
MAYFSFELKMRRAVEHLHAFNQTVYWWLRDHPYRIEQEIDAETGSAQVVVRAIRQPPERLSLMLGDAIQNFRSGLDHLVVDLARAHSGGHLMPRVESDLQFPITTSRTEFKAAYTARARLGCVPPRAAAFIQRMQPYRRGIDPAAHPLWLLQQLSNIDKHRRLPLLMAVVSGVSYENMRIEGTDHFQMGGTGPFKDKAVLLAWSPPDANVQVNLRSIEVDIALGEGLPGAGIVVNSAVQDSFQFIDARIVAPLAEYFTIQAMQEAEAAMLAKFEEPPPYLP